MDSLARFASEPRCFRYGCGKLIEGQWLQFRIHSAICSDCLAEFRHTLFDLVLVYTDGLRPRDVIIPVGFDWNSAAAIDDRWAAYRWEAIGVTVVAGSHLQQPRRV